MKEDKVSIVPVLFKDPVVWKCSVPEPVEVSKKKCSRGIHSDRIG